MAFSYGACKSTGQINRAKRDLECIPPCPQGCKSNQKCIPLRECPHTFKLLKIFLSSNKMEEKDNTIQELKQLVCNWYTSDISVCCDLEGENEAEAEAEAEAEGYEEEATPEFDDEEKTKSEGNDEEVKPEENESTKEEHLSPCQPYVGSLCSKYIGQEYVFVPQGLSQEYIEEKVNETFTAISPSDSCAPYSNKALCMTALPLCNKKTQEPKLICKDDCELLENQLCRQELKEIHGRALLGPKIQLPFCNKLPDTGSQICASIVNIRTPKNF